MAFLTSYSFDHFATADIAAAGISHVQSGGTLAISAGTGRNGTNSLRLGRNGSVTFSAAMLSLPPPSGPTAIVGFGFKTNALGGPASYGICTIWNGGVPNITLSLTTSGALQIRRGEQNDTLIATSSASLAANNYYFIELKVLLSDTVGVGSYEVKIDGAPSGLLGNADTIASGAAQWSNVSLGSTSGSAASVFNYNFDYDDVYVCDGSGATHNNFLGDHRVAMLPPSIGNGTHADWFPSAGTDHGALLDEATPDAADYVSANAVGAIDTLNYPALGIAGTVTAVVQPIYARAEVAGLRQLAAVVRVGSTTYTHPTPQLLGTTYLYYRFTWLTNPATSAPWTVAEIDAAEFGFKVAA